MSACDNYIKPIFYSITKIVELFVYSILRFNREFFSYFTYYGFSHKTNTFSYDENVKIQQNFDNFFSASALLEILVNYMYIICKCKIIFAVNLETK